MSTNCHYVDMCQINRYREDINIMSAHELLCVQIFLVPSGD